MFGISLKKASTVAAIGVLFAVGLLATTSGTAQAGNTFDARVAPLSNPFLWLDVVGGSKGDGAKIIVWPASGSNQFWNFKPVGSSWEIVNYNSGKCLTTDGIAGHQLYQWTCHGTGLQLWNTDLIRGTGVAWPITNVGSGLQMDLDGGRGTQGTPVIAWNWNGGNNQYWLASSPY